MVYCEAFTHFNSFYLQASLLINNRNLRIRKVLWNGPQDMSQDGWLPTKIMKTWSSLLFTFFGNPAVKVFTMLATAPRLSLERPTPWRRLTATAMSVWKYFFVRHFSSLKSSKWSSTRDFINQIKIELSLILLSWLGHNFSGEEPIE